MNMRNHYACTGWALVLIAGAAVCGCSNASLDAAVKKIIQPRMSPQQYLLVAVSDPDPDIRRNAVAKVAESEAIDSDWAIDGFVAIATLETDEQARCVAVRALGKTSNPRAVETCLMILNYEEYPPEKIRPPGALCRWDATAALGDLARRGVVPDAQRTKVRDTLLTRLKDDPDAHVRYVAADGLAFFQDTEALEGLIAGLKDADFAVVHACEMSLVALTGETHDCDAYAWQRWYDQHKSNPFAKAGYIPESRRQPYEGKFGRAWYNSKQVFQWMFPGRKQ